MNERIRQNKCDKYAAVLAGVQDRRATAHASVWRSVSFWPSSSLLLSSPLSFCSLWSDESLFCGQDGRRKDRTSALYPWTVSSRTTCMSTWIRLAWTVATACRQAALVCRLRTAAATTLTHSISLSPVNNRFKSGDCSSGALRYFLNVVSSGALFLYSYAPIESF